MLAKRFIKTTSDKFNALNSKGLESYKNSVVFIEDTKTIWTNGVYYGDSKWNFEEFTNNINVKDNTLYVCKAFTGEITINATNITNAVIIFSGYSPQVSISSNIQFSHTSVSDFSGLYTFIIEIKHNIAVLHKIALDEFKYYVIAQFKSGNAYLRANTRRNTYINVDLITDGSIETFEGQQCIYKMSKEDDMPESLFDNVTSLKMVYFSNNIKNISKNAFSGTSLKYLFLPQSLKSIDTLAFYQCDLTDTLYIPKDVYSINPAAFSGNNLQNIQIDPLNSYFIVENGIIYKISNDGYTVVMSLSLPDVNLKPETNCISSYAFALSNIQSLSYAGNKLEVGNHAFYCCGDLKTVFFSGEVELLGNVFNSTNINIIDFSNCTSIEIYTNTFDGISEQTKIIIPDALSALKNAPEWANVTDQIYTTSELN